VPFLIENGRSGLLVAPGDEDTFVDAVSRLASDPGRCRAIGDAARRRTIERFSAARMIANYAALMKAVAAPD
jgi:glycosyltransferase involved in cell wall biosynthesis